MFGVVRAARLKPLSLFGFHDTGIVTGWPFRIQLSCSSFRKLAGFRPPGPLLALFPQLDVVLSFLRRLFRSRVYFRPPCSICCEHSASIFCVCFFRNVAQVAASFHGRSATDVPDRYIKVCTGSFCLIHSLSVFNSASRLALAVK